MFRGVVHFGQGLNEVPVVGMLNGSYLDGIAQQDVGR